MLVGCGGDSQLRFWCSNFSSHLHSTGSYHLRPLNFRSYLLRSSRLSRIHRLYSLVNMCMAVFFVRQSTRMAEFSRQPVSPCQAWENVYVIRRQEAAENIFNEEVESWPHAVHKNLYHLVWNTVSILDPGSWLISKRIIRFLLLRQ